MVLSLYTFDKLTLGIGIEPQLEPSYIKPSYKYNVLKLRVNIIVNN